MELVDFLRQTQAEVKAAINDQFAVTSNIYPYPGSVFSEIVMEHMYDIGMTFEPVICHFERKIGSANLRLSGFALSDETDQLDLFVSLYSGAEEITLIPDADTLKAAEQCLRFLTQCVAGGLDAKIDEADDAHILAVTIKSCYDNLDQIRIYVLTDRQAKSKNFKSREFKGKTIKLEVMDIERLHRHWSEGKPRDELVVNFEEVSGGALPCVYIPGENTDYNYALAAIPGEALRYIYEKYGSRLLEANVRSFLSLTGKVNKGIRDTLKDEPESFMAYNNGIVLIVDELAIGKTKDGGPGILWLKGMQIVNGGQTTASIYFTKKKNPEIDLRYVRVPAKIIILNSGDLISHEGLISDISKFANSQNSVKLSDLSANKPFHVEIERLALSVYCPGGVGRWFYERAAGSYKLMLTRDGTTPVRLKQIKDTIPPARKINKTQLAKFLNTWEQKPYIVSLGEQKNFVIFMADFESQNGAEALNLPDVQDYKKMIAKVILFKKAHGIVRPMFQAFQGNVTIYLISLIANRFGERFALEKIWLNQDISLKLKQQLQFWASEVHEVLQISANGRMISEWAKKPECWEIVRNASYTDIIEGIPELT